MNSEIVKRRCTIGKNHSNQFTQVPSPGPDSYMGAHVTPWPNIFGPRPDMLTKTGQKQKGEGERFGHSQHLLFIFAECRLNIS